MTNKKIIPEIDYQEKIIFDNFSSDYLNSDLSILTSQILRPY
jgi:hypothetical protein